MREYDFANSDDYDAVDGDEKKGADGQFSPFFRLLPNWGELWTVVGVVTFFKREVLNVDVDGEDIEDLGKNENFQEVREEKSDESGYELRAIEESFLDFA